jgi:hypothetical protein
MFGGQREFRGILISSPNGTIAELMLPFVDMIRDELILLNSSTPSFQVYHGIFCSEHAYAAPEQIKEVEIIVDGQLRYRYDFYIVAWKQKRRSTFLIAVPFSAMAQEVFPLFDESVRARKYKRLNLTSLVKAIGERDARTQNLIATSIRFRLAGGDTVKTVNVAGTDVLDSEYFRRTSKALHGISLVPRRLRLRFVKEGLSFALDADPHGNFRFRLRKEAANLCDLEPLLNLLDSTNFLEETAAFPLQAGQQEGDSDV